MSTAIYYFSATGNSLVVAKDLAQALGDTKRYGASAVIRPAVSAQGIMQQRDIN